VIGRIGVSADLIFLDDTGSNIPSVYEQDDLPLLGIQNVHGQGHFIDIATAGGVVRRRTILITMRWWIGLDKILSAAPILQEACINPGSSGDPGAMRLSGMSLRMQSFSATAPNGSGDLHLADRKHGVVVRLPVV